MRTVKILVITMVLTLAVSMVGIAQFSGDSDIINIEQRINRLLQVHQTYISSMAGSLNPECSSFDRVFFSDLGFINTQQTRNFINTVKSTLGNRNAQKNGIMMVSYTNYQSIDGKVTGVNYKYLCDGKNVTFIKGSQSSGNVIKAVYRYDIKGRLLDAQEYKGNRVINRKTHVLEI